MKTNPDGEALLSGVKPKVIRKEDYEVKIMFPFAIRYTADNKNLTLSIEVKQKEGKWWPFGIFLAVYVEVPICWDNEDEPIPVREAELIMDRLKEVLDKREGRGYKFIPIQANT